MIFLRFFFKKSLCSLLFCVVCPALAKPLVLQYEVSHSRNTDQISLIFYESTASLVVNTSSWQERKKPRLGRFGSALNPELSAIKTQLEQMKISLNKTVPLLSLLPIPAPLPEPHATVLRIGSEEILDSSPYFDSLMNIIAGVWQSADWFCVECASYSKRRNKILRRESLGPEAPSTTKKQAPVPSNRTTTFSKKELSCVSKSKRVIECVDPQYGIFEL